MILEAGADDLLAVVEIFRADEADDGIDQQRLERARDRVGARFQRLLVDAVMRIGGEREPWPVSKYITLSPMVPRSSDSAARAPRQQREIDAEAFVGGFACRRSTGTPDRPARPADQLERGGDMGQHAGSASGCRACCGSSSSIDSSACARSGLSVAGLMPMTASPEPSSRPSRMLAAMPARRRSDGWAAAAPRAGRAGRWCCGSCVTTEHFAAISDQVLSRLILATAAAISGVTPGASAASVGGGGLVGQQPVAEVADGQMRDRREGRAVVAVEDQPRHLVGLRRDDGSSRNVVSGRSASANCAATRSSPVSAASPASCVAGAQRRGLGQQRLQIAETCSGARRAWWRTSRDSRVVSREYIGSQEAPRPAYWRRRQPAVHRRYHRTPSAHWQTSPPPGCFRNRR